MSTTIRRAFAVAPIILVLLAFVGTAPAAQSETGLLDGRTFEVEMGAKGDAEGTPNTLTFLSGTFLSQVCVQYDFPQSEYHATRSGDTIEFRVPARSYTEGHMDWTGTVTGKRLEATAVWYRPGHDEPIEFWIRGSEKELEGRR